MQQKYLSTVQGHQGDVTALLLPEAMEKVCRCALRDGSYAVHKGAQ